ncbi:type VI secretion system-associated FHA domain protein TagH [Pseudoalteromonas sp. MM17-2]|uniref:type VI secretion system-associated FHA domain protein TagH n=1 Tax=Pseudoalteromonas sp. MM17-2 TaxID=2917753 RepID=UPI001EF5DB80|nr:type VI secretion system-associated FHA domain protein TagH [Pseudoalteromonas sp. MM17-2]MCG7544938.1 type VI secretion system-associated FHA domain protein TagH [Pseudoalteromonas sp. MM17-2]
MEATFNVISYHRLSPEIETSKTTQDSLVFGRSQECDWHLPDPEKIISSTHGRIERSGSNFVVHDLSTNGLFVNHSVTPVGKGNQQALQDGDVLSIGDYEIEFKLAQSAVTAQSAPIAQPSQPSIPAQQAAPAASTNNDDLFATQMQSANELDQSFQMPGLETPASAPASGSQSAAETIPEDWGLDLAFGQPESASPASQPAPAAQPEPQPAPAPTPAPTAQTQHSIASTPEPKAPQQTAPQASAAPQPAQAPAAAGQGELAAAFLQGLQVDAQLANELNNAQTWQQMGESLRLLLLGLIESLRQRSSVKQQLRLNHTMFQAQQNNPLKFSATLEDVIQNLYTRNSASFLNAEQAIAEAFKDTRDHDTAMMAGTVGAIEGLLDTLSPERLKSQANEQGGLKKVLPYQLEAKSWRLFSAMHQDMESEIERKGSGALADDFVKAYDSKLKTL